MSTFFYIFFSNSPTGQRCSSLGTITSGAPGHLRLRGTVNQSLITGTLVARAWPRNSLLTDRFTIPILCRGLWGMRKDQEGHNVLPGEPLPGQHPTSMGSITSSQLTMADLCEARWRRDEIRIVLGVGSRTITSDREGSRAL